MSEGLMMFDIEKVGVLIAERDAAQRDIKVLRADLARIADGLPEIKAARRYGEMMRVANAALGSTTEST